MVLVGVRVHTLPTLTYLRLPLPQVTTIASARPPTSIHQVINHLSLKKKNHPENRYVRDTGTESSGGRIDERTGGRIDGWKDGRKDGRTDGQADG